MWSSGGGAGIWRGWFGWVVAFYYGVPIANVLFLQEFSKGEWFMVTVPAQARGKDFSNCVEFMYLIGCMYSYWLCYMFEGGPGVILLGRLI